MLAVLQPLDADLAAFGLDALRRRIVDRHEGGIVDAGLDQIFGELRADARRRSIRLDGVLDDAETLARLEVLIFGADGGGVHQREARLIGLERRAEELAAVEAGGDDGERFGAGRQRCAAA